MTDVKIKCDDCKFVEDCVDYGWQECKKFTPTPSEPMTNEQWFCSLSTEEKAKFLRKIYRDGRDDYVGEWYEQTEADFVEWLKEIHK